MRFNFSVAQELVEDHTYWIARCKEVPTIVGQGTSPQEAIKELEENEQSWLEFAEELGLDIPVCQPLRPKNYSGKFMTRISPVAHSQAAAIATENGISLNQYVSDAISYYNGLNTDGNDNNFISSKIVTVDFSPAEKRK